VISTLDVRTGHRHDLRQTQVMDQTAHENLALELPAWSPDGTKIAYARVDERLGTGELWIVNADGSNPAKVALDADASVSGPRWSPDGTRISFTSVTWLSGGESDSAIGVVELATGHVTRLTVTPDPAVQHACCADWIDDAHLRVQAAVSGDGTRFWAVPLDGDPVGAALLADLTDAVAGDALPGRPSMRSAPGDPGRTFFWQPTGR
jgi:dipeptidyl aminopeptidase/acylaminoacyl peptidase